MAENDMRSMIPMVNFAKALRSMPWQELAIISEHILEGLENMRASERYDRDGLCQVMSELADDILKEEECHRAAHAPAAQGGGSGQ